MKYKNEIKRMMEEDYKSFVIALLSVEKNINDKVLLEYLYNRYIKNDNVYLISENIFEDEL